MKIHALVAEQISRAIASLTALDRVSKRMRALVFLTLLAAASTTLWAQTASAQPTTPQSALSQPAAPATTGDGDKNCMPGMAMPGCTEQSAQTKGDSSNNCMAGMVMPGCPVNSASGTPAGGPFQSMNAIGSGTSLLPSSTPGYMFHWNPGGWTFMLHGEATLGLDAQGGQRGAQAFESHNWLMLMGQHKAGPGEFMFRGMFSAEPFTTPRPGIPELFQTGETYHGRPLIDAQHPHNLFMELAVGYNVPLSRTFALNFYGGPVGEPALGPVAFMHRASSAENPSVPIDHHWQDSTHISQGVVTAGITAWRFKLEGSAFHGAEPGENRTVISVGALDSFSARLWFTPSPDWSMQVSQGHIRHPELLEPGDVVRTTASISHNRRWSDGNLATSLIWGRNQETHGVSNAYLFESNLNFLDKNYAFTRLELVDKQGLGQENIFAQPGLDGFSLGGSLSTQSYRVGAFSFGGVRDVVSQDKLRIGIGASVTMYHVSDVLQPVYGQHPVGVQVFLRIRPGKKM